ncbi:amidohydrolase family protein [Nocardioides sp.]|uniref:amidohydrolase family protein n=1 Tax=Nocardioides sp. TaxID=35761 RepID=UPI0027358EE2|nr:amidohydrolase family protein [Nocardioides sp.]MDP3891846.1 amidohydrolase family protein [Nocardioides sp.]
MPADEVIEGGGGALIPGLHDHHVHLLSAAAALTSTECGPPRVRDLAELATALQEAAGSRDWVRGVDYHESVAGPLDRYVLDSLVADRPVRVQHRSGALWILNSRALDLVAGVLDDSGDVEREESGTPTGRLWRFDARLRQVVASTPPDLAALGRRLTTYGITGVTDATPDVDDIGLTVIAAACRSGDLPVHVTHLGVRTGTATDRISSGPRKLLLRDHDLPTYDDLQSTIEQEHDAGRPVAVHCVTRESLLLTLAVLEDVGCLPGDRIEHASIVPHGVAQEMARLGVRVVTQPGFLHDRGDDYLRELAPEDRGLLYPFESLRQAGVRVTASSDAPFGELDPWATIRAAVERRTAGGQVIGPSECVSPMTALDGYLGSPLDPGGPPRRVTPGSPADLCLLHVPLEIALRNPSSEVVRTVTFGGRALARHSTGTITVDRENN